MRLTREPLGGHGHRGGDGSERARAKPGAVRFRAGQEWLEDRALHVQQDIMTRRIRVGIIGANPDRGWAAEAHIPALQSLPEDFEITALSTSRRESAEAAGRRFGVALAFDNHQDLVNSADVDVVAITVKVPYHFELATAALAAGKAVYCEWPLGNGLQEAEALAALAKQQGVLAVAGLQARAAPPVGYVRDLVRQGYGGEVLSTTLIGSGMGWGPTVEPNNGYMNDRKNGAPQPVRVTVLAWHPRLACRNASLPHIRRHGHAPTDAGRDREGHGNRSASNGRLSRRLV